MLQTLFITILSFCYQTSLKFGNGKHDRILELYILLNLMKKYLASIKGDHSGEGSHLKSVASGGDG